MVQARKGNATEAARQAGYAGSDNTLSSVGYENLRKHEIKKALSDCLEVGTLSIEEVLYELPQIARATILDFYDVDENGDSVLNLSKAKETGALAAVKQIRNTTDGVEISIYSRLKALCTFLEYHLKTIPRTGEEQTWRDVQELSEKMGIDVGAYFYPKTPLV